MTNRPTGCVCPRCGKVLAPWVSECSCVPDMALTPCTCEDCELGEILLTSFPPQYRCKVTKQTHFPTHSCNVSMEEKIQWQKSEINS